MHIYYLNRVEKTLQLVNMIFEICYYAQWKVRLKHSIKILNNSNNLLLITKETIYLNF